MAEMNKDKKEREQQKNNEEERPDAGSEERRSAEDGGDNDAAEAPEAPRGDAVEDEASAQKDGVGGSDAGAQDDYEEEYYYDDFYTENQEAVSDEDANPVIEAGGPIIPDPPDDDDDGDEDDDESDSGKGKKSKVIDEKKMPFLDHLEELRWTIMRSLIAIVLGAIVCFIFSKQIVDFLRMPSPDDLKLIYLSPTEGFMIYIKVALFSGLVVAMPYVAYEFWKFVVPGLLEKERKLVPPIVFFTVLCFLAGGAFAYLVLIPFAMRFLLGFQTEYLEATITIGKYLGFVVTLILVFGVVFELPVLSFFLSKIGLLTPEFLRSKRRYGIVTIFIAAALLTPPDIMTQLMLAFPLIALYEISIFVSAVVVKKKKQKEDDDD